MIAIIIITVMCFPMIMGIIVEINK
jgi:hypothetical protein